MKYILLNISQYSHKIVSFFYFLYLYFLFIQAQLQKNIGWGGGGGLNWDGCDHVTSPKLI